MVARLKAQGEKLKVLSRTHHPEYETVVCDLQRAVILDGALEGLYRKVNVDATVRLSELAVSAGVSRFVFVSSVKAGSGLEDASEGVYGETKREAELRLLEIAQQSCMHVAIVRPALVYGPEVKGNLQLMRSGIKRGWFPPLPETGNRRSMIHVDDLVRALVFVAESKQTNGQIYIATDGVPHSSREIYEAICHSVGRAPRGWSVPKWVFDLAGMMSSKVQYKFDKLLGDEYYSSAKLEALGFKAKKGLMDIHRSDFGVGADELLSSHERLHSA